MASIISFFTWVVANWHLIATVASLGANVALFFMHGANAASIKQFEDFINSINISQTPIDPGAAQTEARNLSPTK